jgi:sterol 3beta-glucosyltransferase
MKIAILTLGTRGDVQPYAVLGHALKQRGHQVTLATAKNFSSLVQIYGLDFMPLEADFQAVLDSEEGKKMMKGNPFAIRRNLHTWVYPLIEDSLNTFYKLARNSDAVLYHVKTLADCFADQFPQKMMRTSVLPIVEPTSAFANPALSGLPIPRFLNRISFVLANQSMKLLSTPIERFRKANGLPIKFSKTSVADLYGISPTLLPVPQDFKDPNAFQGFWFGEEKEGLSKGILEFLDAGDPPLLLTFGSMPFKSKFDLEDAVLQLAQKYKVRIIVVKGWGLNEVKKLEKHPGVLIVKAEPYSLLFPQVRAILHHGGIGTTAACLHAGKPFWICPILYPVGDQLFWGLQSYKIGVALKPVPLSKMNLNAFLEGVGALLSHKDLYTKATAVKDLICRENGLEAAVNKVEAYFDKSPKKD